MRATRALWRWCAVVVAVPLLSSCSWTGLNSMQLPFTKGNGSGAIVVTVQIPNAANLVPNSEVKYDEITIGSVRKIELKNWTATLTLGLEKGAKVPADVTAKVAQKSLLGAEYVALADPTPASTGTSAASDAKPVSASYLKTGDVITLDHTGRYPETEEVLAAASMLLNDGGLGQIHTITTELNNALGGRAGDIKSFMATVAEFTSKLDSQRDNIVTTLQQLDNLSKDVVNDRVKVADALQQLPQGMKVIDEERGQLVSTLQSVNRFSVVAHRVITETKGGLQTNLANLQVVTKALADNSDALAHSTQALTYPFTIRDAGKDLYSDYLNLTPTFDVSVGSLISNWVGATPLDGLFPGIVGGTPTGAASGGATSSGANTLGGLLGQVTGGLLGGSSGGSSTSGGGSTSSPQGTLLGGLTGGLL